MELRVSFKCFNKTHNLGQSIDVADAAADDGSGCKPDRRDASKCNIIELRLQKKTHTLKVLFFSL